MRSRYNKRVTFYSEENGDSLDVSYSNRGEPFREGIELRLETDELNDAVFLKKSEVYELKKLLDKLYP